MARADHISTLLPALVKVSLLDLHQLAVEPLDVVLVLLHLRLVRQQLGAHRLHLLRFLRKVLLVHCELLGDLRPGLARQDVLELDVPSHARIANRNGPRPRVCDGCASAHEHVHVAPDDGGHVRAQASAVDVDRSKYTNTVGLARRHRVANSHVSTKDYSAPTISSRDRPSGAERSVQLLLLLDEQVLLDDLSSRGRSAPRPPARPRALKTLHPSTLHRSAQRGGAQHTAQSATRCLSDGVPSGVVQDTGVLGCGAP